MNRSLVICLFLSMLLGLASAALAVAFGLGVLVALGCYSLIGSLALGVSTFIAAPGEPRPVPVPVPPAVEPAPVKPAYA